MRCHWWCFGVVVGGVAAGEVACTIASSAFYNVGLYAFWHWCFGEPIEVLDDDIGSEAHRDGTEQCLLAHTVLVNKVRPRHWLCNGDQKVARLEEVGAFTVSCWNEVCV